MSTRLNLGCGLSPMEGFVNHDFSRHSAHVDISHDLDCYPWPWGDGRFTEIHAQDVMEHLRSEVSCWLDECWRILADGGTMYVRVPAWNHKNAYSNPTHRRVFTDQTFDFWDKRTEFYRDYGHFDPTLAGSGKLWVVESNERGGNLEFVLRKDSEKGRIATVSASNSGSVRERGERILVLIPMRPSQPPTLTALSMSCLGRMLAQCPEVDLVIDRRKIRDANADFARRQQPMSDLRNQLIEDHLRECHTHVLWIDADVVDYPSDLATRLVALSDAHGGAIAAPAGLMEGEGGKRFYDIAGFIEAGRRARLYPPWFDQQGPVVELDSVGMCYLVPADVYRSGIRYAPTEGFTEHYAVCRNSGLRVVADLRFSASNANLRNHGEDHH